MQSPMQKLLDQGSDIQLTVPTDGISRKKHVCDEEKHPDNRSSVECKGKFCRRVSGKDGVFFSFPEVVNDALPRSSSFKSPIKAAKGYPKFCESCFRCEFENNESENKTPVDEGSEGQKESPESTKSTWCTCLSFKNADWERESIDACDKIEARKYNPIWTGDDTAQIGMFIRNLRLLSVDPENQTLLLHFYLNVVWLDSAFCAHMRNKMRWNDWDKWYLQMKQEEFVREYKLYLEEEYKDGAKPKSERQLEKEANILPNVKIWNLTRDGYDARENVVSLNKKHIGKNTVYWRRMIRLRLYCDFKSRSFPFGYETFDLKIRLVSWTKQHFALLRTKLWSEAHKEQCKKLYADHTFSYINPNNSLIKNWKICSVHNNKDKWYSKFDNNDLTFRLPVRVTRGMDTQSSFEALIILKRNPWFVMLNSWLYFTLSTFLALPTWRLGRDETEGRLGIAVGIVFVQMGLRINTAGKTARVVHITTLDKHIFVSISLVILQAFTQVAISWIGDVCKLKKQDVDSFDSNAGWVNFILVVLSNILMLVWAKRKQQKQRLIIEERVRKYTGFNEEPIGDYKRNDIGKEVRIAGWKEKDRFQIYDQELDDRKRHFKIYRTNTDFSNRSSCLSCSCFSCCWSTTRARTRSAHLSG